MITGLTNVRSAAEEEEARRSIRGGARLGDGERSAAEEEEARRSIRGGARLGDGERSAAEEEEARRSIRGGGRFGDVGRSAAEEEEAQRSIRGGARLGDVGRQVRLGSRCSLGYGERQRTGVCALGCLINTNGVGGRSGTLRQGLPCREEPFRSESALHGRELPRKGLPCLDDASLRRGLSGLGDPLRNCLGDSAFKRNRLGDTLWNGLPGLGSPLLPSCRPLVLEAAWDNGTAFRWTNALPGLLPSGLSGTAPVRMDALTGLIAALPGLLAVASLGTDALPGLLAGEPRAAAWASPNRPCASPCPGHRH